MTGEPTFDVAPLLSAAALRVLACRPATHTGGPVSTNELGDVLGRAPSVIQQWRAGHRVSEATADAVAVLRLGVHPSALWPEWWDVTLRDPDCPHGWDSDRGYRRHLKAGEEPCVSCKSARRVVRNRHRVAQKRRQREREAA